MEKKLTLTYQTCSNLQELPEADRALIRHAMESSRNAYAPYSHFHVGACVRLQSGRMVDGNNQENASYPQGLCAERVALFSASAHYPDETIEAIALFGADTRDFLTPCGGCRQVLLEYEQKQEKNIRVLMAKNNGEVIVIQSVQDLLPFSFSQTDLNKQ